MFETLEEADEVNSECAFCKKNKFEVLGSYGLEGNTYDLIRCSDEDCHIHCKWNHEGVTLTIQIANKDSVAIASGW